MIALAALVAPPSARASQTASVGVTALPENAVRIGIGRSVTRVELYAPGGMYVVDDAGFQQKTPPYEAVTMALEGGRIRVTGIGRTFTRVRFVPVQTSPPKVLPNGVPAIPDNPIGYNGTRYRGQIEVLVSPKDGRLSVVNVVNLEEYLMGVVAKEMYHTWPMEALKAQAVAARTYALNHLGQYAAEGFDLVDTPMNQAYGGLDAEKPSTSEAVMATRGKVLTYGGKLAATFYHSSSGGHTENNEIIFVGSPVPYLRGVPDVDNVEGNKRFSWKYVYTPEEFARKLSASGYGVGSVRSIRPDGEMGASGRPSKWTITGTAGTVTLRAQQLRSALGLPSSPRTVEIRKPGPAPVTQAYAAPETIAVISADGKVTQRQVLGTVLMAGSGRKRTVTNAFTVAGRVEHQSGGIEVVGGGYGHAVGLSQWGAHGMALQGKTYEEILTHYFQGTKVESR